MSAPQLAAAALLRLAADQHLEPRLERTISRVGGGCRIQFRSPALSAAINSLYAYRFGSGIQSQGEDGRYHRTADARVTERMVRPYGREAQLAFLSGAFARRSRDGEFFLVNAEHKAELIGGLLTSLGCSDVWVRSTAGRIPGPRSSPSRRRPKSRSGWSTTGRRRPARSPCCARRSRGSGDEDPSYRADLEKRVPVVGLVPV